MEKRLPKITPTTRRFAVNELRIMSNKLVVSLATLAIPAILYAICTHMLLNKHNFFG